MTIARILAPLTGGPRDQCVLTGAMLAAKPFSAHVAALFVRPDPSEAMPFYGEGMSSAVVQEIMDVSKVAASAASKAARATLELVAREQGVEIVAEPLKLQRASARIEEVEGNFVDEVTLAARLSDLVVFGPLKEDDRPGLAEAFEATLVETGRPVLLVSQPPKTDFTRNIAIAWNGGVASAHAVTAAMPFLEKAQALEIMTVKRPNSDPILVDDLLAYLKLHGLAANHRAVDGGDRPVADVILEAANQCGAGMLIAGGYGHSRLRELFVMGVTRRFAAQASIPCFLVH